MAAPTQSAERVRVDGKFFRLGARKFHVKGITYGPFAPNAEGLPFPEPGRARADLSAMRAAGVNSFRTYHVPPAWLRDSLAFSGGIECACC